MKKFKTFLCWLLGHARGERGAGTAGSVELVCHHIDGTRSSRIVPARVHPVHCSRCGKTVSGDVVFLHNVEAP